MVDLTLWKARLDVMTDEICNNLPAETLIVITEANVMASLCKLRPNKTTGPDGLKACLQRLCSSTKRSLCKVVPEFWHFTCVQK